MHDPIITTGYVLFYSSIYVNTTKWDFMWLEIDKKCADN